jgi:glycosyltransferase involved in cell wall biosynthesis
MKVVVDVLGAPARSGGMRRYAEELIRSWAEIEPQDELVVLGGEWTASAFADLPSVRPRVWASDGPLRRCVGQYLMAGLLARHVRADAVLSVSPIVTPFVAPGARACVVHDWRHVRNPAEFGWAQRAYRRLWRRSVRRAGTVVAISAKTARETSELVPGVHPVVVENGRDHARRWTSAVQVPPRAAGAVLTFGHLVNKRPALVIDAFAAAGDAITAGTVLTVLGARGDLAHQLRERARQLGIEDRCDFPGFVEEAEYQARVRTAGAIVLASSDEGFGLPVAEGEWFGVPVVVTTDSGLDRLHPGVLYVAEPDSVDLARVMVEALSRGMTTRRGEVWGWQDAARRVRRLMEVRMGGEALGTEAAP